MPLVLAVVLWLSALPCAAQQHDDTADDMLQHVPMASVFVIKAFRGDDFDSWVETAATAFVAYAASAAVTYTLKHTVGEQRPDGSDRHSFPSGHATLAFAGATTLCHEHGSLSPWVPVCGYGAAVLVSLDRVRLDRHYLHDVAAGAAIGIAGTELTYLLKKKLIRNKNVELTFGGNTLSMSLLF